MRGTAIYFMLFLLPLFWSCEGTHTAADDDLDTIIDNEIDVVDDIPPVDDEDIFDEDIKEYDIPETENPPDIDMAGWEDRDDDSDGIANKYECTADPCEDTDADGTPDYLDTDSDGDGIPDEIEAPSGIWVDTDKDGDSDFRDTDSDNDGIPDAVEAGSDPTNPPDSDYDGQRDYRDVDSDGDGIKDEVECTAQPCVDSDGDGIPDYLDIDSDNDTVEDIYELNGDIDGDGIPHHLDEDSDGDGLLDKEERGSEKAPRDTDGDNIFDFKDTDSDSDGLLDAEEREIKTDPTKIDTDSDGIDDKTEVVVGCDPLVPDSDCINDMDYSVVNYEDPKKTVTIEIDTPDAIAAGKALWEAVIFEITADENEYGINALDFVQNSAASYTVPAEGAQSMDGTSFYLVVPETILAYDLMLQNYFFAPLDSDAAIFKLTITLTGDGAFISKKHLLIIVQSFNPEPL